MASGKYSRHLSVDQPVGRQYRWAVYTKPRLIVSRDMPTRLFDKQNAGGSTNEARRGWGLKLIEGLMDAVAVEDTDDGTRIRMEKNIRSDRQPPPTNNP